MTDRRSADGLKRSRRRGLHCHLGSRTRGSTPPFSRPQGGRGGRFGTRPRVPTRSSICGGVRRRRTADTKKTTSPQLVVELVDFFWFIIFSKIFSSLPLPLSLPLPPLPLLQPPSKMSGKGAKGLSGKGAKGTMSEKKGDKKKPMSRSSRAGLQFPVGRIHRLLKVRAHASGGLRALLATRELPSGLLPHRV